MNREFVLLAGLFLLLAGCDRVPEKIKTDHTKKIQNENKKAEETFSPFYIFAEKGSKDNHYVPSGFMPDGQCVKLNDGWTENCHKGSSCIKVVYDVVCSKAGANWAGVYWLNPANNWGKRKGGYNLSGAHQLTFWAKGEKGGEQIQEFTIGGINGDYPDTDLAVMGPVILTNEWRKYTIDLSGKDLSSIIGGFSWTTSVEVNSDDVVFYLDEIRFE
ncbi:MAG: hypothetical protein HQL26_07285 [Candidatus Omnitrophica bacterium]|nr:hypothetical protein [Candidatus Omnitrophota bacterium]